MPVFNKNATLGYRLIPTPHTWGVYTADGILRDIIYVVNRLRTIPALQVVYLKKLVH